MTWILPFFEILIVGWFAPVFWLTFVSVLFYKIVRAAHG